MPYQNLVAKMTRRSITSNDMEADWQQQEKGTRAAPGDLYIDGQRFTGKIAELENPHFSPPDLALPELRSPPSMELTLTITPDTAAAILDAVQPAALRFLEVVTKEAKLAAHWTDKYMDAMLYQANDNPKWWHYYKHVKKYRVRKKYQLRLERQLRDKLLAAAG